MRRLVFLIFALANMSAFATTYSYSGNPYTVFTNHEIGTVADYTPSMRVSGWFSTAAPLVNFGPANAAGLVTAYEFSDGINTIRSSDPNARMSSFQVITDGSGSITDVLITVEVWASGSFPHTIGNRYNRIVLMTSAGDSGQNLFVCGTVGTSSDTSVADVCLLTFPQSPRNHSAAISSVPGTWAILNNSGVAASAIPTLSEAGIVALVAMLSFLGMSRLTRRKASH